LQAVHIIDAGTDLREGACIACARPPPPGPKDGGTLRTVLDARAYMLALPKRRETSAQWQRAAELLLAEAGVEDFSKQVELALFYDAKLQLSAE